MFYNYILFVFVTVEIYKLQIHFVLLGIIYSITSCLVFPLLIPYSMSFGKCFLPKVPNRPCGFNTYKLNLSLLLITNVRKYLH